MRGQGYRAALRRAIAVSALMVATLAFGVQAAHGQALSDHRDPGDADGDAGSADLRHRHVVGRVRTEYGDGHVLLVWAGQSDVCGGSGVHVCQPADCWGDGVVGAVHADGGRHVQLGRRLLGRSQQHPGGVAMRRGERVLGRQSADSDPRDPGDADGDAGSADLRQRHVVGRVQSDGDDHVHVVRPQRRDVRGVRRCSRRPCRSTPGTERTVGSVHADGGRHVQLGRRLLGRCQQPPGDVTMWRAERVLGRVRALVSDHRDPGDADGDAGSADLRHRHVVGRFEPNTGTVTFFLFGPDNPTCAGAPVFTSANRPIARGTATSEPFTPTAAGTYNWVAVYSGIPTTRRWRRRAARRTRPPW